MLEVWEEDAGKRIEPGGCVVFLKKSEDCVRFRGGSDGFLRGVLEGLGAGGNMDLYGLRGVEDTDGRPSGAGLIYEGGNESSA